MPKKILIIEDDLSLREFMMKYFLEQEGYFVITAEDNEVGLEIAIRELPELIIFDVVSPKINGFELLQLFSNHDLPKNIPRIMLIGMDEVNKFAGAPFPMSWRYQCEFITKPFLISDLYQIKALIMQKNLVYLL